MPLSGPISGQLSGQLSGSLNTDNLNSPGGGGGPVSSLNNGLMVYVTGDGVDAGPNSEPDTGPVNGRTTGAGFFGGTCMAYDDTLSQYDSLTGGNWQTIVEPGGNERTYSMWVFRDSATQSMGLLSKGTGATGFEFYMQTGGDLVTYLGGYIVSSNTVGTGAWHHCLLRYRDGVNSLFLDGVETTGTRTRSPVVAAPYLGRFASPVKEWDGRIDQFCVWDRELTDDEIVELYNAGAGTEFLAP